MNCIIIEDEVPAQEILVNFIGKIPDLNLLAVYNSAIKANAILQSTSVDVIFLDINLPTVSGINYLKTLESPPAVIMTTAYTNYAVESFEFDSIVDYLVKPFSFERFLKSINKIDSSKRSVLRKFEYQAVEDVSKNEQFVFVNVDKTLHKIELDRILFIQSDRNYVTIVTTELKLSFIDTLKNWETYLDQDNYIRVHKSFILNINYIEKLTGNVVYIRNEKIPVGKTYREALFAIVKPIN